MRRGMSGSELKLREDMRRSLLYSFSFTLSLRRSSCMPWNHSKGSYRAKFVIVGDSGTGKVHERTSRHDNCNQC
jgi:hypothetical protein